MKKTLLSVMTVGLALLIGQNTFAQTQYKRCATDEYMEEQKKLDPTLEARLQLIEQQTQEWIAKNYKNPSPKVVVKIPIVFHIVYKTAAENISDQMCLDQLKVLNDDYRKKNADWTNTPSVYQSLVADCEVEFCLAKKDPAGANTTGITRTQTTVTSFSTNNAIKYNAQGGKDAWDTKKYLNFWVGNLGGGLLGYAQFPGGSAATDGAVILYSSLPGGTASPYNLGRTATHEVGHWLNLRHIWGDANCGDDQVSDTPTQQTSNFGCPTFPKVTCSNGPNGDLFVNYMDYTDDACMVMFTNGQKTRVQACLATSRNGLGPHSAIACIASGMNEYLNADNISIFPNPSTGLFLVSAPFLGEFNTVDLVVYNTIGSVVKSEKITNPANNAIQIDLTKMTEGIYFFEFNTPEGKVTKKVIVSK